MNDFSLLRWRSAFFATLGLSPLMACSSSTSSPVGQADASVNSNGGSSATGGGGSSSGGGGSASGGSASGGTAGKGGSAGSGGKKADAGGGPDSGNSICQNPSPVLVGNQPTGFVSCTNGFTHRPEKLACPSILPRALQCGSGHVDDAGLHSGGCAQDSDCKDSPNGYCSLGGFGSCFCNYGCTTDADCGVGEICGCTSPVGQCIPAANCTVDADCGSGMLCMITKDQGCGYTYACQTPKDTCATASDCESDANFPNCIFDGTNHVCAPQRPCGTGRPFLVAGEARVAARAVRTDWQSALEAGVCSLGDDARAKLTGHWTETALLEHASIAAFARFSLELLALGAPAYLVESAHAAMADETVHARDAFALASSYAGAPIGPGRLEMGAGLLAPSLLDVFRTTILEGCIGETVAAVEAAEALAGATDPAVRAALSRVAPDETRHAELAWRFVQWVLDQSTSEERSALGRELVSLVQRERQATEPGSSHVEPASPELLAHGAIGSAARASLRRRVLADVVEPCALALVAAFHVRRTKTESVAANV